jgi:hypothetical protein
MSALSYLVDLCKPKKLKKMHRCLARFDHAYKNVSKLLPEVTVGSLIDQLADNRKEPKNV